MMPGPLCLNRYAPCGFPIRYSSSTDTSYTAKNPYTHKIRAWLVGAGGGGAGASSSSSAGGGGGGGAGAICYHSGFPINLYDTFTIAHRAGGLGGVGATPGQAPAAGAAQIIYAPNAITMTAPSGAGGFLAGPGGAGGAAGTGGTAGVKGGDGGTGTNANLGGAGGGAIGNVTGQSSAAAGGNSGDGADAADFNGLQAALTALGLPICCGAKGDAGNINAYNATGVGCGGAGGYGFVAGNIDSGGNGRSGGGGGGAASNLGATPAGKKGGDGGGSFFLIEEIVG